MSKVSKMSRLPVHIKKLNWWGKNPLFYLSINCDFVGFIGKHNFFFWTSGFLFWSLAYMTNMRSSKKLRVTFNNITIDFCK